MATIRFEKGCEDCGHKIFILNEQTMAYACGRCGLETDDIVVDYNLGRNIYNPDTADHGYTTEMGKGLGSEIGFSNDPRIKKLIRKQRQIRAKENGVRRSALRAKALLDGFNNTLHLVGDLVKAVMDKVETLIMKNGLRNRSLNKILPAIIYCESRLRKTPRSLDELCEVADIRRKELNNSFKYVRGLLKYKLEAINPAQYIVRFCDRICAPELAKPAAEIAKEISEKDLLIGKSPTSIAATAIYVAASDKKSGIRQYKIAEATETCETTLRRLSEAYYKTCNNGMVL